MTALEYEPVILSTHWTASLYRFVIFSVSPGRRVGAIVGPRGATDAQVIEAVRRLASNINT